MANENRITFTMLLNDYFETHHLREDTRWSYEKVIRTFINFIGEDVQPADISKVHVHQWRQKVLYEQKLSTWTWNNKVRHMRAVFNHAIKTGLFIQEDKTFENPFYKVVVRQEMKSKKILSSKQMAGLYLVMERHEIMEAQGMWKGGAMRAYAGPLLVYRSGHATLYRYAPESVTESEDGRYSEG